MQINTFFRQGFTLVELLVVLAIIALLSTVLFAGFDQAREQTRDKSRLASLKELQLAIEQYRAQYGTYPATGCGAAAGEFAGPGGPNTAGSFEECTPTESLTYVTGVVPDFITVLPRDSQFELDSNRGFYYRSDGVSYKLMLRDVVETLTVDSFDHEYARCPSAGGGCPDLASIATTYAVYSLGAESW
jgi:prepilin-type N-terminal cleavage/methylation domain-containing protein